jgi:hypothetical protein
MTWAKSGSRLGYQVYNVAENGRTIYRPRDEDYYDRVRAYRGTFPYEKALRMRKVWIEPLFAEAKDWHGTRRFRLRRLEKVNVVALLIATGQNVKRLLTFEGRRPKKPAQAAALRPPDTFSYERSHAQEHRARRSWRPTKVFFNSLGRFRYIAQCRLFTELLRKEILQTSHALGFFEVRKRGGRYSFSQKVRKKVAHSLEFTQNSSAIHRPVLS